MTDLEYLGLSKGQRFISNIKHGFKNFFLQIGKFFKSIPFGIWKLIKRIGYFFLNLGRMFKYGDTATRVSYGVMGIGCIRHKQYLRGFLYLGYEIAFIVYMIFFGWKYLSKIGSLGTVEASKSESGFIANNPDNSFYILLFSIGFVIVAILCKVIGCGLVAKGCKFNWNDSTKIGVGMMTRGEVALIVSQKGLSVGLLDPVYFTSVIFLFSISSSIEETSIPFLYGQTSTKADG